MYVPPFESMLRAIAIDRTTFERSAAVLVPKELFKLLITMALTSSEFNEAGYLRDNPDVADALQVGDIKNAREHYISFGYFECRTGGTPEVDERWYLATYSDVAQGVKVGQVRTAKEHYDVIGAAEGRSPSANFVGVAARWKRAFSLG